jgi:choline kinase
MNKSATNNKSVKESIIALNSPKSDEEFEKKIYDNNVDKIKDENGNLVALSKSNFADKIYKDQDGFAEFDISEFDKIFEIIQEILQLSI